MYTIFTAWISGTIRIEIHAMSSMKYLIQLSTWIMHMVCVLLCLGLLGTGLYYQYPSGLPYWHGFLGASEATRITWVNRSQTSLQWRHNGRDSFSNHQPYDCLLNRLFRRRSKKTSNLRVTDLCAGNSPGPVKSPHKWPVTRKMFPFEDVIR